MRRHYQILFPLLSLFLVRVDLTDLFPMKVKGQILEVIDGDTLRVKYGHAIEKLRLSKIDAPEKGQPFLGHKGDAGLYAKKCVKALISKKEVIILPEKRDIYGRLLGDVLGLSLRLVEEGCVSLYPHSVFSSKAEKYLYLRTLQKAKAQMSGLWKYGGVVQPKVWRKKFSKRISPQWKHRPVDCRRPCRPGQKSLQKED
jgi:micrococcal nuclease